MVFGEEMWKCAVATGFSMTISTTVRVEIDGPSLSVILAVAQPRVSLIVAS